jgi:hypothetical protein
MGTLHEIQYTFFIITCALLTIKMLQTTVVENIKTHIVYSVTFFFLNVTVCEVMWKNIVQPDRPQMTIWCMCIACWICKDTDTHSEYLILIAFPLQHLLHE